MIKVSELDSQGAKNSIHIVWLLNLWLKPTLCQEPQVLWGPRTDWTELIPSKGEVEQGRETCEQVISTVTYQTSAPLGIKDTNRSKKVTPSFVVHVCWGRQTNRQSQQCEMCYRGEHTGIVGAPYLVPIH